MREAASLRRKFEKGNMRRDQPARRYQIRRMIEYQSLRRMSDAIDMAQLWKPKPALDLASFPGRPPAYRGRIKARNRSTPGMYADYRIGPSPLSHSLIDSCHKNDCPPPLSMGKRKATVDGDDVKPTVRAPRKKAEPKVKLEGPLAGKDAVRFTPISRVIHIDIRQHCRQ